MVVFLVWVTAHFMTSSSSRGAFENPAENFIFHNFHISLNRCFLKRDSGSSGVRMLLSSQFVSAVDLGLPTDSVLCHLLFYSH